MKPQKFFPFFLKKNSDSNEEIVWGELFSDVSAGENPHDLKLSKNLSNDLIVDYLKILKAYDLRTAVPKVSGSDLRFHRGILSLAGIHNQALNKFLSEEGIDILFSNKVSLSGFPFKDYSHLKKSRTWSGIERINSFYQLIDNTLDKEGIQLDMPYLFVEMPLLELNAEARKTESGYLFLINESLISFLLVYSFLYTASMQHYLIDTSNPHRRENMNAVYAIFHLITEFSRKQTIPDLRYLFALARFDLLRPEYSLRAKRTFLTILRFIMYHEIGHGYLGHLNNHTETTAAMSRQLSRTFSIAQKSLDEEDAADQLAAKLVILDGESSSTIKDQLINFDKSFFFGPDAQLHYEGKHPVSRIMAISSYFDVMCLLDDCYDYLYEPKRWEEKKQINAEMIPRGDDCTLGTTHRYPGDRLIRFWYYLSNLTGVPIPKGEVGILMFSHIQWHNFIFDSWASSMEGLMNKTSK